MYTTLLIISEAKEAGNKIIFNPKQAAFFQEFLFQWPIINSWMSIMSFVCAIQNRKRDMSSRQISKANYIFSKTRIQCALHRRYGCIYETSMIIEFLKHPISYICYPRRSEVPWRRYGGDRKYYRSGKGLKRWIRLIFSELIVAENCALNLPFSTGTPK